MWRPVTQASFPCLRLNVVFGLRIPLDFEMFESSQSGYPGCRVLIETKPERERNVFNTASPLLARRTLRATNDRMALGAAGSWGCHSVTEVQNARFGSQSSPLYLHPSEPVLVWR